MTLMMIPILRQTCYQYVVKDMLDEYTPRTRCSYTSFATDMSVGLGSLYQGEPFILEDDWRMIRG